MRHLEPDRWADRLIQKHNRSPRDCVFTCGVLAPEQRHAACNVHSHMSSCLFCVCHVLVPEIFVLSTQQKLWLELPLQSVKWVATARVSGTCMCKDKAMHVCMPRAV